MRGFSWMHESQGYSSVSKMFVKRPSPDLIDIKAVIPEKTLKEEMLE